jgi:hypothetical protein
MMEKGLDDIHDDFANTEDPIYNNYFMNKMFDFHKLEK